jgi:membrane-associated protein
MVEFIRQAIGCLLHIDTCLKGIVANFGVWSYLLLFVIIFAETGLVVTPFLPGDSLLFAAGTFAALGSFNVAWLFITLAAAAIIGDSANYAVGRFFGEKLFANKNSRIFKKEYLDRTHKFYEKYGGKTIVIARFVPIVRTFAPFIAGVGKMSYMRFFLFNVTGGVLWIAVFVVGGFYFGNMPMIKENFSLAILVIIILSLLPGIIEFWKHKKTKQTLSK